MDFFPIFWFHNLFKCDENIKEIKKKFTATTLNDEIEIINNSDKRKFKCGKLLIKNINSFKHMESRGNRKLHFICGSGEYSSPSYYTDFLCAQNHPEFEGATFQIESSAMCIQNADSSTSPLNGITDYVFDTIQGAIGAAAAAPAAFYRNYFCSTRVNLLSGTPFHLQNGYVIIKDDDELDRLENLNFDWSNQNHYKIGIQRNNEVLLKRDSFVNSKFCINDNPPKVHQIFCVRFDFCKDVLSCPFTKQMVKNILEAQYRLSILAAWENSLLYPDLPGSKILFLVPLGAELGTSRRSIAEALSACVDLIIESGLEVYFSCPDQKISSKCLDILQKDVDRTGGKIIKTRLMQPDDLSELDSCSCCRTCSFGRSVMLFFAVFFVIALIIFFKTFSEKYIKI